MTFDISGITPELCSDAQAFGYGRFLMEQALTVEQPLDASVHNCHDIGIDSVVLFDRREAGGGMVRIFIANHDEHRLDELHGPDGNFTVGVHNHGFDLRIIPLTGIMNNVEVRLGDKPKAAELHEHTFGSALKDGIFSTTYRRPVAVESIDTHELHPGDTKVMDCEDLHTVQVPKAGDFTAWMLLEGPAQGNVSRIYSVNPTLELSNAGLYIPMPVDDARSRVEQILERTS